MVYRFRVAYEEHEDVYRDIDIKSSQTFDDLHYMIQQAISFDNSKPAFFYLSDDYWRKEKEIPLGINQPEKEKKARVKKENPLRKKVIADYVNDPHQKFIYVFDPEKEWTFLVELIRILPADTNEYPKCVKSVGTAPKQYKETNLPPPPPEEEDEELKKLNGEKDNLMEEAVEKAVLDEGEEGIIPLGEEDVKTGEEDETEKPADEEEEGESSDEIELDDED